MPRQLIQECSEQWCGNSQSCRTLSDKSSECPVMQDIKLHVYKVCVYMYMYMGSRTRVMKIGHNAWQLAQCFHTPGSILLILVGTGRE